ncbi:MAG TPA: Clp protease N-terminal domain-containing protein [Tepidisphaeraceae bacterium]
MYENLTKTLRDMLDQAQRESRQLNQEFVSTEHLVLGILDCLDGCDAGRALRLADVNMDEFHARLLRQMPKGAQPPAVQGDLPFTPKAQRAINSAIVRAQALREHSVSTRLLLLSLLDEPQCAIRQALQASGADMDLLQRKLAEKPATPEA